MSKRYVTSESGAPEVKKIRRESGSDSSEDEKSEKAPEPQAAERVQSTSPESETDLYEEEEKKIKDRKQEEYETGRQIGVGNDFEISVFHNLFHSCSLSRTNLFQFIVHHT